MKTFSIIIPVYNGQDVIGRALDSVYSQGLTNEQFEVICVDDCSPTMDTYNAIKDYTYNEKHPINLRILRHDVNKRQGAARNTAIKQAEGEYVLYLDADDYFVENSLIKLQELLSQYNDLDCAMYDFQQYKPSPIDTIKKSIYASLNLPANIVMSGEDFIQKYPIPWTPTIYAYKRTFLLQEKIYFVENAQFEDTDYVMRCTLYAKKMVFLSLDVMTYVINYGTTTTVGNNRTKITELFKLSSRMKTIAESFIPRNYNAAMAAMNHHLFHYKILLKKTLWRLPYKTILDLLYHYPPYDKSNDKIINFAYKNPKTYAIIAQFSRPFLLTAIWLRNKIK